MSFNGCPLSTHNGHSGRIRPRRRRTLRQAPEPKRRAAPIRVMEPVSPSRIFALWCFAAQGNGAMPYYRLYHLDPDTGHFDGAEEMFAVDDVAAIHFVQLHAYGVPVELWQGGRKIRRIDATPAARGYAPRPVGQALN